LSIELPYHLTPRHVAGSFFAAQVSLRVVDSKGALIARAEPTIAGTIKPLSPRAGIAFQSHHA
jgi:hypothetical protein